MAAVLPVSSLGQILSLKARLGKPESRERDSAEGELKNKRPSARAVSQNRQ